MPSKASKKKMIKMRKLFVIDKRDYSDCTVIYKKDASRALIFKNEKILMLQVGDDGFLKFPGGGIENGEKPDQTLKREVLEECGKKIIDATISLYGYVIEKYKSDYNQNEIFESKSYYFFSQVELEEYSRNLTVFEKKQNLKRPQYYTLEDAYNINKNYLLFHKNNIALREMLVLKLLITDINKKSFLRNYPF